MKPALLFDLDETLMVEEPAATAAFAATAQVAATRYDINPAKLAASGLGDYLEAVVVSAELGVAKPDAAVFEHAVSQLGVDSSDAVMIGDSISKDVDGALAAGLGTVWVNRNGRSAPADREDLVEISTLSDLPSALGD